MMGLKIQVKDGLARWIGGLGRLFGKAGDEAAEEIGREARPPPRDEAEEALWQAMGWSEPAGEDAGAVVRRVGEKVIG